MEKCENPAPDLKVTFKGFFVLVRNNQRVQLNFANINLGAGLGQHNHDVCDTSCLEKGHI